jgi:hypothetical protein
LTLSKYRKTGYNDDAFEERCDGLPPARLKSFHVTVGHTSTLTALTQSCQAAIAVVLNTSRSIVAPRAYRSLKLYERY